MTPTYDNVHIISFRYTQEDLIMESCIRGEPVKGL